MDNEIDRLSITIEAEAQKANTAIDLLADKLDRLYTSLGRIDGTRMRSLASGVTQLSSAVKGMASIDGRTFTAMANNINKIANINSSGVGNSATAITNIASAFNQLGNASQASQNMSTLVSAISKLGNKGVTNAIVNIPQLASALNQLMVTLSKAPTVNQSVIAMTNALANLAAQGSKVGSASKSVVNGLNRTNVAAKRTASSTMSLARAFGKFYANYFLLVRGFKGMFNMMESAMELTETVNYFEVTLRNIGESARENWKEYGYESADAYADSFAERLRESNEKLTGFAVSETGQISQSVFSGLGINPATATQYSAMFAQVANSIGMTEEASIALSEAFVRLGADWASLRNVDFDVAYEKLASGLAGQSRALRAFGVDITMATLQEIAFANGIEKSVSEMTQSEKAYLRLIAIIEQSEVAFGDLTRTLYSPANQMRMLSQGVQNLGTLVGNLFLPVLKRTLPVLNGFVIALQRIVIAISESMGIDTSKITESYTDMTEGFYDASEGIDEATESAEKFNRATRSWDELNVLGKDMSKGYGVGNDLVKNEQLLDAYDKAIEKYRKAWEEAYENINNEAEDFADGLLRTLNVEKIVDNFTDLADSVGNISDALLPLLGGVASGFSDTTFGAFKALADFAGDITENADPATMKAVGEAVGTIIANLLLYKGVSDITTKFVSGIKGIGTALSAHPILGTFALSAGIIQLLELPQKIRKAKAEEFYSDMADETLETSDALDELAKEAQKAKEEILNMSGATELENAFKKWSELALKSEELTDSEKVMLKAYEERLIEVLPSAKQLIEENVGAYDDVIGKVKELMQTEQLRLKMLSYEDYLSLSLDLEVGLERELEEAKQEFSDVEKQIKDMFSDISDFELKQIIDAYSKLDKTEILGKSLPITIVDIFGEPKQFDLFQYFDKSILKSESWKEVGQQLLGTYGKEEAEKATELFELYEDRYSNLQRAESDLERQKEDTKWATEQVTKAQKDYNNAIGEGTEKTDGFNDSLGKVKGVLGELGGVFVDTYEKAKPEGKFPTKEVGELDENTQGAVKAFTGLIDLFTNFSNGKIIGDVDSVSESFDGARDSIDKLNKSIDLLNGKKLVLPTIKSIESKLTLPSSVISGITSSTLKSSAVADLLGRNMAVSQQPNVNVTFDVKGDPNGLFTVVQQKANQYSTATGKSAFK